jgi:hypothetical protein
MATAVWVNPIRSGRLQGFLASENIARKIELLQHLFPDHWRDGERFVEHLRRANVYRNNMAHWGLAMSGSDGTRSFDWHFYELLPKAKRREIDLSKLDREILRVHVLCSVALAIMGEPYIVVGGEPLQDLSDHLNLNNHSLADRVIAHPGTWRNPSHRDSFIVEARAMFPKV